MKITKKQLRQLISEEYDRAQKEMGVDPEELDEGLWDDIKASFRKDWSNIDDDEKPAKLDRFDTPSGKIKSAMGKLKDKFSGGSKWEKEEENVSWGDSTDVAAVFDFLLRDPEIEGREVESFLKKAGGRGLLEKVGSMLEGLTGYVNSKESDKILKNLNKQFQALQGLLIRAANKIDEHEREAIPQEEPLSYKDPFKLGVIRGAKPQHMRVKSAFRESLGVDNLEKLIREELEKMKKGLLS